MSEHRRRKRRGMVPMDPKRKKKHRGRNYYIRKARKAGRYVYEALF